MKSCKPLLFFLIFLLPSCGEEDVFQGLNVSFDAPYPKRTKNLSLILGDVFSVRVNGDTLSYRVVFRKADRRNYIISRADTDTLFAGTVSRYRGLYYFSTQLNDTAHWIHAVDITDDTIRGLGTEWEQMAWWEETLESPAGHAFRGILQSADAEHKRLRPEKGLMRRFYENLMDSLPAFAFIKPEAAVQEDAEAPAPLPETPASSRRLVARLYPQPAKDHCTLELRESGSYTYGIYDTGGRFLDGGRFKGRKSVIDLSEYRAGVYFLRVFSSEGGVVETVRLVME